MDPRVVVQAVIEGLVSFVHFSDVHSCSPSPVQGLVTGLLPADHRLLEYRPQFRDLDLVLFLWT